MRISLFNSMYKPDKSIKVNQDTHLKNIYEKLKADILHGSRGSRSRITTLEVCSSQAGCAIKKYMNVNNIQRTSKFVAYVDRQGETRSKDAGDPKKYVRMVGTGVLLFNRQVFPFSMRFFRNGNVAVQIGLSNTPIDPLEDNADKFLFSTIMPNIQSMVEGITGMKTTSSVSLINSDGGSLFGQNGDKLPNAIKNFMPVMKAIDKAVKTYEINVDPGIGRRFVRITFKTLDEYNQPSMNITSWGYCQIMGAKSCADIKRVFKLFKKAIAENKILDMITYDMNKVEVKTVKTKNKVFGCPKGNPEAKKGVCPSGHHPRPKVSKDRKQKTTCCYKGEPAKRHIKPFLEAEMEIPAQLKRFLKPGKEMKRKETQVDDLRLDGGQIVYKGKRLNANKLNPVPKGLLINIAKRVGLMIPKAKKSDLFREIVKELKGKRSKSATKSKSKTPSGSKKSSGKSSSANSLANELENLIQKASSKSKSKTPSGSRKSSGKSSSANSLANELENLIQKVSSKSKSKTPSGSSLNSLANELEKNLLKKGINAKVSKKNNLPVYPVITPPPSNKGSPIPKHLYNIMHPKTPNSKSPEYVPKFPVYQAISPPISMKGSPISSSAYRKMHPRSPN